MAIDKDTQRIITYVAVAGGAYILVLKPLLVKLGIVKSSAELMQEQSQQQNISDYVNQSLAKQSPTKSKGEWQLIADNIYNLSLIHI